jgi:hypothetical protein
MGLQENSPLTFLMIGCQRCGTTWTDAALREHPQIYLPCSKQSYFFDRNYANGLDWYMKRFDGVGQQHLATGEIATGYCLLDAIPLMAEHFPNIKLLMLMRNPIDRAYSNYQSRKIESKWSSFEQALDEDPDLLLRGQYIDQIEILMKFYDREKVMFLLYDDLHSDDKKFLRSILTFIGVEPNIDSKLIGQRKNASMFPKLRKLLHQVGLKPIVSIISKSWIGDSVRRSRKNKGKSYQPMKQETKNKLIEHFKPYNKRLSSYLGRDLLHWDAS